MPCPALHSTHSAVRSRPSAAVGPLSPSLPFSSVLILICTSIPTYERINHQDWIKISEMLLGPVPDGFQFQPKHKANSYSAPAGSADPGVSNG